jgi:cardiolipin synthase
MARRPAQPVQLEGARGPLTPQQSKAIHDRPGNRFSDALIRKQAQGVQVNFIYDSVGSINTPAAFFKRLTDSGIKVRPRPA